MWSPSGLYSFVVLFQISELESELESEQRSHQEALKESKRADRKLKELLSQSEDDRHNQVRLQETVEKLNNKVRFYKRQAEETEEVAASNLNKFRAMSAAPARRWTYQVCPTTSSSYISDLTAAAPTLIYDSLFF